LAAEIRIAGITLVAAVLFAATSAASAEARDQVLWNFSYQALARDAPAEGRYWNRVAQQLQRSCQRQEDLHRAVSRVPTENQYLKGLRFVYTHASTLVHLAGYDDACSAAKKFSFLSVAYYARAPSCLGSPCTAPTFSVRDHGVRQDRPLSPDVCRWQITLGFAAQPNMSLNLPC
jgi:hypothetical protein